MENIPHHRQISLAARRLCTKPASCRTPTINLDEASFITGHFFFCIILFILLHDVFCRTTFFHCWSLYWGCWNIKKAAFLKFSLRGAALNVSLALAFFTIKTTECSLGSSYRAEKDFTLVPRRLRYQRGFGQVTGDLTRVGHLALATVGRDGAVQTVSKPDGRKRWDVDGHLKRNIKSI